MTQDEVMDVARQASKEWLKELPTPWETANQVPKRYLEIFAKLVDAKATAKEREACANVCEELFTVWVRESKEFDDEYPAPLDCAEAIRARGEA